MSRSEILDITRDIFREIFDDDTLEVTDATTSADIEEWDSLEQINILLAMATAFGVKFSVDEVEHLTSVGEMVDLVCKKQDN
jgi:acyl carrier protein